jgi:alpha-glucosidase
MLVDGKIGEFCIFARQERSTDNWYIGGINADEPRDVTLPLNMLAADKSYQAVVFHDGEADWQTKPYDYRIDRISVSCADTLRLRMASGGGFAVRIVKE